MNELIAKHLLNIQAVFLQPNNPFTWASGIKSPIYCDNRLTVSYPEVRRDIADGLAALITEYFPEVEVIAGAATGGIAHAAWVSERLNKPMVYVRSTPKGHGKGKQVEGVVKEGQKVVVVEDLVSTGGSVFKCVEGLKNEGCDVIGVVAIFSYDLEQGKENFKEKHIELHTLTNYNALVKVAAENGYIEKDDVEKLEKWRKNPLDESWIG